jgi:hypothetical protein
MINEKITSSSISSSEAAGRVSCIFLCHGASCERKHCFRLEKTTKETYEFLESPHKTKFRLVHAFSDYPIFGEVHDGRENDPRIVWRSAAQSRQWFAHVREALSRQVL